MNNEQLSAANSRPMWRSLAELEGTKEFKEFVHREFPQAASEFPEGVSRRRWLQLMGASFSLAMVSGCRWQAEEILPMATRAPQRVPGESQAIATSIEWCGMARHLVVTCYDGRPVKIEGNTKHPHSLGATDMLSQAAVLDLYDPDRSSNLRENVERQVFQRSWNEFEKWLDKHRSLLSDGAGEGVGLLLSPSSSPSREFMVERLEKTYPKLEIFEHTSVPRGHTERGASLAFGESLAPSFDLSRARTIVCLDDDLLTDHAASVRYTREFANRRDPEKSWMNRLYVAESQFSLTGSMADHRLPIRAADIEQVVADLERAIAASETPSSGKTKREKVMAAIVDDLLSHPGQSLITLGEHHPAELHARVHALNHQLKNVGETVLWRKSPSSERLGLPDFIQRVEAGGIHTAFIVGCNPVHSAAGDVDVEAALGRLKRSIHLGGYLDETGALCQWHLPQSHPFEAWSDVRTSDGWYSVSQPLIDPLLDGKSELELLGLLLGDVDFDPELEIRAACERINGELSDKLWRKTLHDGILEDSEYETVQPQLAKTNPPAPSAERPEDGLELVFTASDTVFDGSVANNSWLQETPDHLTKLTWDNAAIISPATAKRLGVRHGHLVQVRVGGAEFKIPAFILPGQADGSIGLDLGYGRTAAGSVAGHLAREVAPVGVNVNVARKSGSWFRLGAKLTPTDTPYELATTQDHHAIDTGGLEEIGHRVGELVREGTRDEYAAHPDFAHDSHHGEPQSLWEEPSYDGHAWGMSIDLNKCIGCNACLVACQSENNVPVVGKDQVSRGREMHWIRTDRYFVGEAEDPQVAHQVVTCQHCENAPCEQVCPVAATVHSDEGLNDMVYNRCVGTRYCANNCPYKVRRFNFFDYNAGLSEPGNELVQLGVNPEVTVRSRGVMEKCTYCVQRIQSVKIDAKNDARPIRDGELMTACQQACPAQAIEFGDLNDPNSRVSKAHANPRAYKLLGELNVKPRTAYLARIRNPHPSLAETEAAHA